MVASRGSSQAGLGDHGADTAVGEQLHQERAVGVARNQVGARHAALEARTVASRARSVSPLMPESSGDCAAALNNFSASGAASSRGCPGARALGLGTGQGRQALRVDEEDQLLGVQRDGDRSRDVFIIRLKASPVGE